MKRILVTGGTGFVGANLVRTLLGQGHELHLIVRPNHKSWRIQTIIDKILLHEVNVVDQVAVDAVIESISPEWVFHLAAYGAYSSQKDLSEMIQTNILGTAILIQACRRHGVRAMVNAGSSSEYGFKSHGPPENERLEPNSNYAVTKASATLLCQYASTTGDLRIQTLRLYSVYGPYEEPTRLLPKLITYGLRGGIPPLVDPSISRDFVHVDDVTRAFILAAEANESCIGGVYNVGSGLQTSLCQLVDLARRIMAIRAEPIWGSMSNRDWDTSIWEADARRIRSDLGWCPEISLEVGLRGMIAWFRENPDLLAFYERQVVLPE